MGDDESERADVIETETGRLLDRYDLYDGSTAGAGSAGLFSKLKGLFGDSAADSDEERGVSGIAARPEPAVLAEDAATLTEYQVEKLLYYLKRDFTGYERIDGIKHDVNVEDSHPKRYYPCCCWGPMGTDHDHRQRPQQQPAPLRKPACDTP